ncbi:MAG: hypothetical protein Rubg2KO_03190 [Rubricoccaceae bacterium]
MDKVELVENAAALNLDFTIEIFLLLCRASQRTSVSTDTFFDSFVMFRLHEGFSSERPRVRRQGSPWSQTPAASAHLDLFGGQCAPHFYDSGRASRETEAVD